MSLQKSHRLPPRPFWHPRHSQDLCHYLLLHDSVKSHTLCRFKYPIEVAEFLRRKHYMTGLGTQNHLAPVWPVIVADE